MYTNPDKNKCEISMFSLLGTNFIFSYLQKSLNQAFIMNMRNKSLHLFSGVLFTFLSFGVAESVLPLTSNYLKAGKDGTVSFAGQCEDRALQLIDNAAKYGKRLHLVPLSWCEYYKWYGKRIEENRYHTVVGALVGDNEFWYIEPSDDRHWLAQFLD